MNLDKRATRHARATHARGTVRLNKLFGWHRKSGFGTRLARARFNHRAGWTLPLFRADVVAPGGRPHHGTGRPRRRRSPALERRDKLTRRSIIRGAHAQLARAGELALPPALPAVSREASIAFHEGLTRREARLRLEEELRGRYLELVASREAARERLRRRLRRRR